MPPPGIRAIGVFVMCREVPGVGGVRVACGLSRWQAEGRSLAPHPSGTWPEGRFRMFICDKHYNLENVSDHNEHRRYHNCSSYVNYHIVVSSGCRTCRTEACSWRSRTEVRENQSRVSGGRVPRRALRPETLHAMAPPWRPRAKDSVQAAAQLCGPAASRAEAPPPPCDPN